jgi:F-type H+-transporting ATPase subunit b
MDFAETLSNIGFDWRMALANLINFLIILVILKKFAFNSIRKTLTERQDKIEKGLEDAQKAATELQMAQSTRDKTLMNARLEADKILTATNEASSRIVAEAKQVCDQKQKEIVIKAKEVIESEKQKMLTEVKGEIVKTVIQATEKMIGKKLDPADDQALIKDLLK